MAAIDREFQRLTLLVARDTVAERRMRALLAAETASRAQHRRELKRLKAQIQGVKPRL